jgi:hypothetical protein
LAVIALEHNIENIATPKEEEPHSRMKKFWTYIKHNIGQHRNFLSDDGWQTVL